MLVACEPLDNVTARREVVRFQPALKLFRSFVKLSSPVPRFLQTFIFGSPALNQCGIAVSPHGILHNCVCGYKVARSPGPLELLAILTNTLLGCMFGLRFSQFRTQQIRWPECGSFVDCACRLIKARLPDE